MPAVEHASLLLPEGSRLVHVGPPKTGTTALQAAFHAARPSLLAQGVRYAGGEQHSRYAVKAALERPAYRHESAPPSITMWQELVDEIRNASEPRVILSSEIFTDGGPEVVGRLVDDLGRDRLHIALTLRPLPRILASQWQQEVRGGQRLPFDVWLQRVFSERGSTAKHFWHRHRHDRLVATWAAAVGAEHVTVVVVDERDHGVILRAFEQLLGLRDGTLVEVSDQTNRSMSLPELESVRAFNVVAKGLRLPAGLRYRASRLVRRIVIMPEPDPTEPRLEAPQWALDRAGAVARQTVDAIATSGVRVIGDLESLAAPHAGGRPDPEPQGAASFSVARSAWDLAATLATRSVRRVAIWLRGAGRAA